MIRILLETVAVLFLFLFIHWIASVFYSTYCVQSTLMGFLQSFFTASSPVCKCLLEIQYRSIGFYDMTFVFIASFLVQILSKYAKKSDSSSSPIY
jgi:hypothetical protein